MNNVPVPMDIGGGRRNRSQNWRNQAQANVADTSGIMATIRTFQGNCFNCGKPGHMAKDCRGRKNNNPQTRTGYTGYPTAILDEEEDMGAVQTPLQGDRTNQLAQMIASMSMNELNQTMNQVPAGENQDFVGA